MNTIPIHRRIATASTSDRRARQSFRPWYRWILTAFAFPPSGYLAHLIAGRVDSVPTAILNGFIAGAGIGAAQWVLLRHRSINRAWIALTSAGLGAGLAAGAALVSYRTDITSLAVMGAVCGLTVGVAQGVVLGHVRRALGWSAVNAALWALGWTATTAGGIDVSQQWAVFGLYGCLTVACLQSPIIATFMPAPGLTETTTLKVTS